MHYLLILSWYWEILTCVKSCFWLIQLSTSVNLGHLTDSDLGWVLSVSEYEPKITNYSEFNFFNQFSIFWLIQLNSTVEFTWARFNWLFWCECSMKRVKEEKWGILKLHNNHVSLKSQTEPATFSSKTIFCFLLNTKIWLINPAMNGMGQRKFAIYSL